MDNCDKIEEVFEDNTIIDSIEDDEDAMDVEELDKIS